MRGAKIESEHVVAVVSAEFETAALKQRG